MTVRSRSVEANGGPARTLICGECGRGWRAPVSPGLYPTCCPKCVERELRAREAEKQRRQAERERLRQLAEQERRAKEHERGLLSAQAAERRKLQRLQARVSRQRQRRRRERRIEGEPSSLEAAGFVRLYGRIAEDPETARVAGLMLDALAVAVDVREPGRERLTLAVKGVASASGVGETSGRLVELAAASLAWAASLPEAQEEASAA